MRLQLVTGKGTRPRFDTGKGPRSLVRGEVAGRTGFCSHLLLSLAVWIGFGSIGVPEARADESTGTWSGSVEGRGNYYWERSTRVVVPDVKAKVVSPGGVRIGVGYLLDAITSASIAAAVTADQVKTELRHGIHAEVGKELELGSAQLDLGLNGSYSTENDYKSFMVGLLSSLSWNEKNSKLTLTASRVQDRVLSNIDQTFNRPLSGFTLGPSFEQVLSPVLVLTVGYQFGYLQGFLGNPYRRAAFSSNAPKREAPPETRFRHAVTGRLAWHLPRSNTSLHLMYTAYGDSWDIAAISPELRVYQQIGADLMLRPRYRFYVQSDAYFAPPKSGKYPVGYGANSPTTNDPKLVALRTHTAGLALEYRLSFLATTVFDFAKDAWLDIGFDRYWSTSSFGNGIIGTAGGRLTF
jgi:hypothetical protein